MCLALQRSARPQASAVERGRLDVGGARPDRPVEFRLAHGASNGRDSGLKNDLAVAYARRALDDDEPIFLLHALETIEQSVREDPNGPEARFNQALILERLHLLEASRRAAFEYLELDTEAEWLWDVDQLLRTMAQRAVKSRWTEEERSTLTVGLLEGSSEAVGELVRRFPLETRRLGLEELLPSWGEAYLAGDVVTARRYRTAVSMLAVTQVDVANDSLLLDAVEAIDRSSAPGRLEELARGLQLYRNGRLAYDRYDTDQTGEHLAKALERFRRAEVRFAAAAAVYLGINAYREFENHAAFASLQRTAATVPATRYPSLAGDLHWQLGAIHYLNGRPEKALAHYQEARHLYGMARETDNLAAVDSLIALCLDYLGRRQDAWVFHHGALERLPRVQSPKRRYSILTRAARGAFEIGLPAAARTFQDQALLAAREWSLPAAVAEAHWWRSRMSRTLGETARAHADLRKAELLLPRIESAPLRRRIEGDVLMSRGEALLEEDPGLALQHLDASLETYLTLGVEDLGPFLYHQRARAKLKLGFRQEALSDLEAGIRVFERRRGRIEDTESRMYYFERAQDLFEEKIRLQVEDGAHASAHFDVERARAQVLLERLATAPETARVESEVESLKPDTVAEIQRAMPAGMALLGYLSLPDELLIWVITRESLNLERRAVPRRDLERRVDAFNLALRRRAVPEGLAPLASELHEELIGPTKPHLEAARTLVIVADRKLHGVAFAALIDPATGRYLVEDHTLAIAPSATIHNRTQERARAMLGNPPRTALLVGDPAFDRGRNPLPRLPGARWEALTTAELYPHSDVMLDEQPRPPLLRRTMAAYDVVHFGAHSILNAESPAWSKLLLAAGDSGGGELHAWEIRRMDLSPVRVVTLAACQAADGRIWAGEGLSSLARAFLAAGVSAVVAPLWAIDDQDAGPLMIDMHRNLSAGHSAHDALRRAQLAALRSGHERRSHPVSWAGFGAFGGAAFHHDPGKGAHHD